MQTTTVERIWKLTKEIELATAVCDWPDAARLASERSPLVMSLSVQQSPEAKAALRKIFEMDRTIVAHARTAQTELTAEYAQVVQGARGVSQYQRIAQL